MKNKKIIKDKLIECDLNYKFDPTKSIYVNYADRTFF